MGSILDQLTSLTAAELDTVISKAKALRQLADPGLPLSSPRRGTDEHDWILSVMVNVCREHGLAAFDVGQVEALKHRHAYKAFRADIPRVNAWVGSFAKGRTMQRAVYHWAYEHMALEHGWGLMRMLASSNEIPRMLNELLPGYYQAGLMGVAMEKVTQK